MVRGTFANVRLRNKITPDKEGGYTKLFPDSKVMTIYEAAEEYKKKYPFGNICREKNMELDLQEIGRLKVQSF